MSTHIHVLTGERVTVTGHVNGITIFDSEDEEGEELLDYVFDLLFVPDEVNNDQIDPELADLLYVGWTVIANADGWGDPPTEWRQAAEAWRERWYAVLARRGLADGPCAPDEVNEEQE